MTNPSSVDVAVQIIQTSVLIIAVSDNGVMYISVDKKY